MKTTYPQVSLVQVPTSPEAKDVRVLVCFTGRPSPYTSGQVQPGIRYNQELAACEAVIAAAVREQQCTPETLVVDYMRRGSETKVTVASEVAPGKRETGIGWSGATGRCLAAAEACLAALLTLPKPDPKCVGLRVRL